MKIIFLDIDGVLNGWKFFTNIIISLWRFFHLTEFIHKHYDIFAVHKKYVKILAKIINKSGAKVVVSSSWRGEWMLSGHVPNWERKQSFKKWMKYYNIEVIDITPKLSTEGGDPRPHEIQQWLDEHKDWNIESFYILDDECQELQKYFPHNVVCTSSSSAHKKNIYENAGLKRHHIKEALNILNCKER